MATQTIVQRLDAFPDFLTPLRKAAGRYLRYHSVVAKDGVINIGHRPWVAELNYMLMLYPGIAASDLDRYCRRFKIKVPEAYRDFLAAVNGGFVFGMSLYGVPRSMLGKTPVLDRSVLQCHDLATAAIHWAEEYQAPAGSFHFGSRDFSENEKVGYFFDAEERIFAVRKKKKSILGAWATFEAFLADELPVSEKLEEKLNPAEWDS